jgi:hypothetical protein
MVLSSSQTVDRGKAGEAATTAGKEPQKIQRVENNHINPCFTGTQCSTKGDRNSTGHSLSGSFASFSAELPDVKVLRV